MFEGLFPLLTLAALNTHANFAVPNAKQFPVGDLVAHMVLGPLCMAGPAALVEFSVHEATPQGPWLLLPASLHIPFSSGFNYRPAPTIDSQFVLEAGTAWALTPSTGVIGFRGGVGYRVAFFANQRAGFYLGSMTFLDTRFTHVAQSFQVGARVRLLDDAAFLELTNRLDVTLPTGDLRASIGLGLSYW